MPIGKKSMKNKRRGITFAKVERVLYNPTYNKFGEASVELVCERRNSLSRNRKIKDPEAPKKISRSSRVSPPRKSKQKQK